MRSRHTATERKTEMKSIRMTQRDKRILETIHAFDGMMSLKQIDRLFFSGNGGTWPRERMRDLMNHGYVNMPDGANEHRVPMGETIYYLDSNGAELVAGLNGELAKDFTWRRKPRWSLIAHDLAVNDFRIDVMLAAHKSRSLTLQRWVPESEFWSHPDTVEYKTANGKARKRKVIPDGFFTVRQPHVSQPGVKEELAFLLEIDMGTEDNPRFAREKVRPGVAYLKSEDYQARFGVDYGRWLVVTTGQTRLNNLKAQIDRAGGEGVFYFTTFDDVSSGTVLKQRIWRLAGDDEVHCIIPEFHEDSTIHDGQIPATKPLAAGMEFSPL
jgi:hypothetical protein